MDVNTFKCLTDTTLSTNDIKVVPRNWAYFKDLKVLLSDNQVYLCSDGANFQIIYKRSPFDIFTICSSNNRKAVTLIFNNVKSTLNGISNHIVHKPKSKEAKMIKSIADVAKSEQDLTWVHVAARLSILSVFKSKTDEVSSLLNNQDNQEKLTPLMIAIKTQKYDLIKAILALEPDHLLTDKLGNTVLHLASNLPTHIFLLVLKHCYLHSKLEIFEAKNLDNYTALQTACYNNNIPNVLEFLRLGLPVHILTIEPTIRYQRSLSSQEQFDKEPNELDEKDEPVRRVAFTSEQIALLDTRDIKYGGSPLHWCKNKKLITKLLQWFQFDSINSLQETPLHVMVRNKRLECIIPLLHFGAPVDAFNFSKQTPLHLAIIEKDVKIVQALIVFDCNVNLVDGDDESPRHLAAKDESIQSQIILFLLHSFGANRCPASKVNCANGCALNGTSNGTPLANWPNYDNVSFQNEIIFFNELKPLQPNKVNSQKKPVNMICLDGGGTRGLNTIQVLIEMQKLLSNPLEEYFDWIGGTSTGSIIGSSMVLKNSLKQIRHEYFVLKDEILNPKKPHNSDVLDDTLKRYLGNDVKLASLNHKKLLITSVLADRDPPKLFIFRSYPTQYSDTGRYISEANLSPIPNNHENILLWEACRASCAAPYFFRPAGPFLDGGLISNNPTLDFMTEFFKYNQYLKHHKKIEEVQKLNLILSIGTGKCSQVAVDIFDLSEFGFRKNPVRVFKTAYKLLSIGEFLTKIITQTDDHIVERAQYWCSSIKVPYFRINPLLAEKIAFDEKDDVKIIEGLYFTKLHMLHFKHKINQICQILEDSRYSA